MYYNLKNLQQIIEHYTYYCQDRLDKEGLSDSAAPGDWDIKDFINYLLENDPKLIIQEDEPGHEPYETSKNYYTLDQYTEDWRFIKFLEGIASLFE